MNRKERRLQMKRANENRNLRKDKNGDDIKGAFSKRQPRLDWKSFSQLLKFQESQQNKNLKVG